MMKRLDLVLAVLTLLTPIASLPAAAAEDGGDRYGSLATGMPYDREIRLSPNTRRIGVWRLETIRFVTMDGQVFTWRFDGLRALDDFPLSRIAPADISVPSATVYVNGEIPISDV